jgi:hypothetical protein
MVTSAFNYTMSVMPQGTNLLPNMAPTSILVGFSYATPNSLTNAYNHIVNTRIPNGVNFGTTATLPVIVGSSSQDLTFNGSIININCAPTATHTMFNGMTSGGVLNIATASGSATLNIGNMGPLSTNLRGNAVSITGNTSLTLTGSQINISTGATAANTLILGGTSGFTNHNIAGNSLTLTGISQNISSISALALGASRMLGLPQEMCIALTSELGAVTVSTTPAAHFRVPRPWRIRLGVRANLYTPSTTGAVTIDIRSVASAINNPTSASGGTSIFTTLLTIDATRNSSIGSAAAAVLTTAANNSLNDDSGLAIFCTAAGTGAAGLKIILYYSVV